MGQSYLAWAKDPEIREQGGSGGFVTATLLAALEIGLVDEVLLVKRLDQFEGVPFLTSDPDEIKSCSSPHLAAPLNLSSHIPKEGKIAVTVKPCDARAIIERAKRGRFDLENVYMIGLNCGGTMPSVPTMKAVRELYGLDPAKVIAIAIIEGKLVVTTEEGEHAIPIDEVERNGYGRRESCKYCNTNIPLMADLACGSWGVPRGMKATFIEVLTEKGTELFEGAKDRSMIEFEYARGEQIDARLKIDNKMRELADQRWDEVSGVLDNSNRLEYYVDELSQCIHCGSCKIACPVCVCEADAKCLDMGRGDGNYRISLYNMIRLFHLMDSCIGCGQCEDVCPVDLPLTMIHQRFERRMDDMLGYRPGFDMKRPPLQEPEPGGVR